MRAETPKSQSNILPSEVNNTLAANTEGVVNLNSILSGEHCPGNLTFDVAMDDIITMEECECSKQLANNEFSVAFVDNAAFAGFHLASAGEHPNSKPLDFIEYTRVLILPPCAKSIAIQTRGPSSQQP